MHRHLSGILMASVTLSGCSTGDELAAGPGLPSDTLHAETLVVIGELDGPPEYLFGDVASVAVGPDSIVYVADGLGSNVRAYGLDGQFLATIATEGDGPGELRFPNDLSFDPQGLLNVRQRYRLTVFTPRASGQLRDSVVRTVSLERPTLEGARAKTNGALFYSPSYYYFMFVRHRYFYEVLDPVGPTGDTIPVPAVPIPEVLGRANYPVEGGGIPVEGVNLAPFEPRPHWDVTPDGRVLMTLGADYEVFEILPGGDTLRVIDVDAAPVSVPPRRTPRQRRGLRPAPRLRSSALERDAGHVRHGKEQGASQLPASDCAAPCRRNRKNLGSAVACCRHLTV